VAVTQIISCYLKSYRLCDLNNSTLSCTSIVFLELDKTKIHILCPGEEI